MSMARKVEDLVPDIAPFLPLCPRPAMLEALRSAWRELCRRTGIWRVEFVFDRVADRTAYPLTLQDDVHVRAVHAVHSRSSADLASPDPATRMGKLLHPSWYRVSKSTDSATTLEFLTPIQDSQERGFLAVASLLPQLRGDRIQSADLLERYGEALAGRAIHELASRPRRPWTSAQNAAEKLRDWNNGLNRALAEVAAPFQGRFGEINL